MPIPYNSLLNKDWYARMKRNVVEGITGSIRGTGSEANDPFWMARQAEGLGDLEKARKSEIAALIARGNAMRSQAATRNAAYQRRATAGLQAQAKAPAYLTQPGGPTAPAIPMPSQAANIGPGGAPASPEAYPSPYSQQDAITPAYNPSIWKDPNLERRKARLGTYYGNLASRPAF